MTLQPKIALLPALLAGCALLPASSQAQFTFESHTIGQSSYATGVIAHADFNGDGREDLVLDGYNSSDQPVIQLYLSDQNGTYQAPVTLPASVDAVGDFNHDGKLDFASFKDDSGNIDIYLGNGDGTFQSPKVMTVAPAGLQSLTAVDLNHDNKTDLVTVSNTPTSSGGLMVMQIWLSNGDGTFTKGQTIDPLNQQIVQFSFALAGDFDGDGKPDIALVYSAGSPTTVQVWYGDGAGHLASPYQISDPDGYSDGPTLVADLNNDGRSDLVSVAGNAAENGVTTPVPALTVFSGNSNRSLTFTKIATDECPSTVAVADFNGDGLNDLAYGESVCDQSSPETNLVARAGQGGLSFGTEQTEYTSPFLLYDPYVIRSTTGSKPDLVFTQSGSDYNVELLSNTSSWSFPGCGLSGFAEGVQVCSPGGTAASPVQFSVAAAGPTPMRTAAVWADGKKVAEQLTHAFSSYSFLDASIPLASGSHTITVYGTGWDNTLQEKTFTLAVGSSGSCAAPTSAGVHLCQPASGSSVASPVVIQAAAKVTGTFARMEVWIDGVEKYSETSSPTLNVTLTMAAGTHRFAVLALNTAGTKWEQAVNATVK